MDSFFTMEYGCFDNEINLGSLSVDGFVALCVGCVWMVGMVVCGTNCKWKTQERKG